MFYGEILGQCPNWVKNGKIISGDNFLDFNRIGDRETAFILFMEKSRKTIKGLIGEINRYQQP